MSQRFTHQTKTAVYRTFGTTQRAQHATVHNVRQQVFQASCRDLSGSVCGANVTVYPSRLIVPVANTSRLPSFAPSYNSATLERSLCYWANELHLSSSGPVPWKVISVNFSSGKRLRAGSADLPRCHIHFFMPLDFHLRCQMFWR